MITHAEDKVVDSVIELVKKHFGELTVTRGNEYTLIRRIITINDQRWVEIEIQNKLKEVVDLFKM